MLLINYQVSLVIDVIDPKSSKIALLLVSFLLKIYLTMKIIFNILKLKI